jgi:hypothetical protein
LVEFDHGFAQGHDVNGFGGRVHVKSIGLGFVHIGRFRAKSSMRSREINDTLHDSVLNAACNGRPSH